jgi:hypothetical protein
MSRDTAGSEAAIPTRVGVLMSARVAVRMVLEAWPLVIPLCVVYGLVITLIEAYVPSAVADLARGDMVALVIWSQGAFALFCALVLYLVVQIFKRRQVSRASWLPTLLVLPAGLFALGVSPMLIPTVGVNAMAAIAHGALGLAVWIVLGGLMQPLWVSLAHARWTQEGPLDRSLGVKAWRARWREGLVAHGAAVTVIFLGLQALFVPGFIFAVSLAYAVHGAMIHDAPRPLRSSRRLVKGDSLRVACVLGVGLLAVLGAQVGMLVAFEGLLATEGSAFVEEGVFRPERVVVSWLFALVYPGGVRLSPWGIGAGAALGAGIWAVVLATLTGLYLGRRQARA